MADQTTITVSTAVKNQLAQAKGERSWDDFLGEVARDYVDDAIALAEQRLHELRTLKASGLTLEEVDALRASRRGGVQHGIQKGAKSRNVGASRPSSRRRRDGGA